MPSCSHLESNVPWGAQIEVQRTKEAPGFRCKTDGPGYAAARLALEEAYGKPVGDAGSGGSIPLLRKLQAPRQGRSSSCGVLKTSRPPASTRPTKAWTLPRSRRW